MGLIRVVCQVVAEESSLSFTWSDGPDWFHPYSLAGFSLGAFRKAAREARALLRRLVEVYQTPDVQGAPACLFDLAASGHALYQQIFDPPGSKAIEKWLTEALRRDEIESLEIVVDAKSSAARENLVVPWTVVYGVVADRPAFEDDASRPDALRHFWGRAYSLATGIRADPLRRKPRLDDPRVLFVVDTPTTRKLSTEAQGRLRQFVASRGLPEVHTKEELQAQLSRRPEILYWFSHATPEQLFLGNDKLSAQDLYDLLHMPEAAGRGGIAFLNGCQTAENQIGERAYLSAITECGMSGIVGTEHETIDHYANELGLTFLERFLGGEGPIAALMRRLRGENPLGLLYSIYCPPHISVIPSVGATSAASGTPGLAAPSTRVLDPAPALPLPVTPAVPSTSESGLIGALLGAAGAVAAAVEDPAPAPLPPAPYLALAAYDKRQRALFAGRREDCDRFIALLGASSTRLVVLQGASGVGKTSFLQAEVIPFLEEESIGYRFLRPRHAVSTTITPESSLAPALAGADPQGESGVMFVRAGKDLIAELVQALWAFIATPYPLTHPTGERTAIHLQAIVRTAADFATPAELATAVRNAPRLLSEILVALTSALPFALVLIVDQAEEIFTHDQAPPAVAVLRALVETTGGDYKVIVSLRTEYYGRLVDALRVSPRRSEAIREYLLTDFSHQALVDAIERPTVDRPLPYAAEIPRVKYGFRYDVGLAGKIAGEVREYAARGQDSVLPLIQVICTQLFGLVAGNPKEGDERVIRQRHLDDIGGVSGGMVRHVDRLIRSLFSRDADRAAMRGLLGRLFVQQPDGTLTTGLVPEAELEDAWSGTTPFSDAVEIASRREHRLLNRILLNDVQLDRRRYLGLGHDSLARVAQRWQREDRQAAAESRRLRRIVAAALLSVGLTASFAYLWRRAESSKEMALAAQAEAVNQRYLARAQERVARAQALAARAVILSSSPSAAVLVAIEAFSRSSDEQTKWALMDVLEQDPRLKAILSGGAGGICETTFSSDGRWLVARGCAGSLDLWEVESRRRTRIATAVGEHPVGTAILGGNELVAVALRDGTVRFWSGEDGKEVGDCRYAAPLQPAPRESGPFDSVPGRWRRVAFAADGSRIAFTEGTPTVEIVRLPDCQREAQLRLPAAVGELALSSDGRVVGAGGHDGSLTVMDILSQRIVRKSRPIPDGMGGQQIITDISFSPDGTAVALTYFDGTVKLVGDKGEEEVVHLGVSNPTAADFNSTARRLAVATRWHGRIALWDMAERKFAAPLEGHSAGVYGLSRSGDGSALASASAVDDYALLWSMDSTCRLCEDVPGVEEVGSAAFGPNGELYYSRVGGSASGQRPSVGHGAEPEIGAWAHGRTRTIEAGAFALEIAPLAMGTRIVVVDARGETRLVDIASGRTLWRDPPGSEHVFGSRVSASADGSVIAYAHRDFGHGSTVQLWNGTKKVLPKEFAEVIAMRVSRDGLLLTVADRTGEVSFWNTRTATEARPPFTGKIENHIWKRGELSADGSILVEGEDNRFRLWDLRRGQQMGLVLTGHASSAYEFAFSHDSQTLASAADDGTIRLWAVATQRPLGSPLHASSRLLERLEFSPGGDRLLTVEESGRLRIWSLDPTRWRAIARRMVTRNLSPAEWRQFFGAERYRPTFPDLPTPP